MTINALYCFIICVIKSIFLTYVSFYGCRLPLNLVTLHIGRYLSLISWNESDCLQFSLFVQLGGGLWQRRICFAHTWQKYPGEWARKGRCEAVFYSIDFSVLKLVLYRRLVHSILWNLSWNDLLCWER